MKRGDNLSLFSLKNITPLHSSFFFCRSSAWVRLSFLTTYILNLNLLVMTLLYSCLNQLWWFLSFCCNIITFSLTVAGSRTSSYYFLIMWLELHAGLVLLPVLSRLAGSTCSQSELLSVQSSWIVWHYKLKSNWAHKFRLEILPYRSQDHLLQCCPVAHCILSPSQKAETDLVAPGERNIKQFSL